MKKTFEEYEVMDSLDIQKEMLTALLEIQHGAKHLRESIMQGDGYNPKRLTEIELTVSKAKLIEHFYVRKSNGNSKTQ